MKKKNISKVCSVVLLGVLSAGNILFVQSDVWNLKAATVLDIAAWDAPAYQVESASQLKDGGYTITSGAAGFQSEIQVAVTFDAAGEVIQNVEVISQGETEGLGTKVTDESFLGQFRGTLAPVALKGKNLVIVSPGMGAVWGTAGAETETAVAAATDNRTNPERWNPSVQSPEAIALRNMYRAGLLTSAIEKQPLQTALADESPDEQAAYRLEEAGLTTSTGQTYSPSRDRSPEHVAAINLQNAGLTTGTDGEFSPSRDESPEGIAARKLQEAGLIVAAGAAEVTAAGLPVSGDLSELDAVSGATVSSTAVIHAIDNAYFFMQEKILN